MSRLILSRPLVGLVFFIERWVLSLLFLFLAWEQVDTLRLMVLVSRAQVALPGTLLAHDGNFSNGVTFDDYARYILLTVSFSACGALLLVSRRPTRHPTRSVEILLPFAATFAPMLFNRHIPLPAWMVTPLIPDDWKPVVASFGIVVSLGGLATATYAILWLGRSMGIVVSVREVVLAGPYRWVRHPIYLGYLFVLAGMFLTTYTPSHGDGRGWSGRPAGLARPAGGRTAVRPQSGLSGMDAAHRLPVASPLRGGPGAGRRDGRRERVRAKGPRSEVAIRSSLP